MRASRPAETRKTQRRFILPGPWVPWLLGSSAPYKKVALLSCTATQWFSADVRASVRVGFSAFRGGTDREGRGLCLGTECPETWGSIVVLTSGFRDLLPSVGASVGALIELHQRERLKGLSSWVETAPAFWRGGMDCAQVHVV